MIGSAQVAQRFEVVRRLRANLPEDFDRFGETFLRALDVAPLARQVAQLETERAQWAQRVKIVRGLFGNLIESLERFLVVFSLLLQVARRFR